MSDTRTLREKLQAMADQDVSPNEAEIARAKLDAMGAAPPLPPQRPPAVGAPMPGWMGWSFTSTTTSATTNAASGTWTVFRFGGRQQ